MQLNDVVQNFRVTSVRRFDELTADLVEMEHEQTGARLVWLNRVCDNKTFGIAFRTTPENDTGVFHILEHSVLCGSEKYPVKEPFVELMKSSMQTFLNAMTYPDKTFYPVSSRNDKDFINLMRVYLDAVFCPAIYEKPEIFHQEGWHFELRDNAPASYKGVVFNEMKGAFASPRTLIRNEMNRLLFPDTCYRFVSGGDPAHIPDLSYEEFLETHRRFYHPSNSYIYLDGSINLSQCLKILDKEYLSRFTRREMHTEIAIQKPVKGESTIPYEISAEEALEGKTRVAWGFGLGDYTNRKEAMAMHVLSDLLCGNNHAPLQKEILSVAEDGGMQVMDGTLQSYVVLFADHLEEEKVSVLKEKLEDTIRRLLDEGLDHEHLKATLANQELQYRERDYGYIPQGLGLGMEILSTWLYGGDPGANLSMGPLFQELNALVDTGWYETLLENVFLKNDHTCQVVLVPSHTAGEENRQAENDRLVQAEGSWTQEEREVLLAEQEKLDAWQASTDAPEDVAKLPRLELADISPSPEDVPTVVDAADDITVLRHELSTGGISYWNLYFDISDLAQGELSDAAFLCQVLGHLPTRTHSVPELQKLINFSMGQFRFFVQSFSRRDTSDTCSSYLCASFSALEGKLTDAVRLVTEILTETDYSAGEMIQNLVMQCRMQMEQTVIGAGNSIGMKRVMAGICAEGVASECTSGYTYLQALKAMSEPDGAPGERLAALSCRLLHTGRLTVSVTGSQKDMPIRELIDSLPHKEKATLRCVLQPWETRREGIVIPGDISFAVQGCPLPYTGQMIVAGQIVSLAYLWNTIRVQGGAYGAGLNLTPPGCGMFYSYRDPGSARSLQQYGLAPEFLESFASANADLTGFIIGAVAGTEPLMLPARQGAMADGWYFRDRSYEDRCLFRKEMLHTTAEDLLQVGEALKKGSARSGICVVGPKALVEACEVDMTYSL